MSANRQTIQTSLHQFQHTTDFRASATGFFKSLGYESNRTIKLADPSAAGFRKQFDLTADQFDAKKAHTENWQQFQFLFQFGDKEVQRAAAGEQSLSLFNQDVNKGEKNSFFFHAVQLKPKVDGYRRTELAEMTRQLNRPFGVPTVVLFEHSECLTLGVINRRPTKSKKAKDKGADVLEKVTLIKDIDLKKPHPAHVHILEELRLGNQADMRKVTNFDTLLNGWRATLSTTELNKRFYRELADWYFWALQHVEFPADAEPDAGIRHPTAVIRLITRLIFVWFLKEKKLVPRELFDENAVREMLNFKDKTGSTYYKAILQNLFFATLNNEMNTKADPTRRRFIEKSPSAGSSGQSDYLIPAFYRYERFFKNPAAALQVFAPIPFLNGGLFESLDCERPDPSAPKAKRVERIDCFSDNPKNEARLKVPDFLFFEPKEQDVDLNEVYGNKKKQGYKVRGLFPILNSYKFTVAENTPVEEEVALDPELLGKVFENLLASYNPETKDTARRRTGSFYTPRDVVEYMAEESLVAYLGAALTPAVAATPAYVELGQKQVSMFGNEVKKQASLQLEAAPATNTAGKPAPELLERLRDLLTYNNAEPRFTATEKQELLTALHRCRILDPACGSGAYPMGVLPKMVLVLRKLDPKNEYWRKLQEDQAAQEMRDSLKVENPQARQEQLDEIHRVFSNNLNDPDYARKLYLIENCIFGADIQPIAVQISKLRCFISLIVDQKPAPFEAGIDNRGIRPLPNLETKFVAANSLINLTKGFEGLFGNSAVRQLESRLLKVRHDHFLARARARKENLRRQDEKLREQLVAVIQEQADEQERTWTNKLTRKEEEIRLTRLQAGNKATPAAKATRQKHLQKLEAERRELLAKQPDRNGLEESISQIARWNPYDQNAKAQFFNTEWMFGEAAKEGFDIVIGNPPYIQIQHFAGSLGNEQEKWAKQEYASFSRTADVYCLFYEQGIRLLRPGGLLCYITSNKWMKSGYGSLLRTFFAQHTHPLQLIDFSGHQVFESATVDTNVLLAQKPLTPGLITTPQPTLACVVGNDFASLDNLSLYFQQHAQPTPFHNNGQSWVVLNVIEARIKAKIEAVGTPLKDWDVQINYGIKTGYNEAFIIDGATKDKLLKASPKSAEIIRPILRGRDVKQYRAQFADFWLLNTHNGQVSKSLPPIDALNDYPHVFNHLSNFKQILKTRQDKGKHWTNLRNCAYLEDFAREKIIWIELTDTPKFALDIEGYFLNNTIFFMTGRHLRYLLGFLNSSLCEWYFDKLAATSGVGTRRWIKMYIDQIKIPQISELKSKPITDLVDEAVLSSTTDVRRRELKGLIDTEIFHLLALTQEEADFVKKQHSKKKGKDSLGELNQKP